MTTMIAALFRYINRHRWPFILLLLIWLCGAYLLQQYGSLLWAELDRLWIAVDEPQKGEDPPKANYYLQRALERVEKSGVDLKLMRQACNFLPLKFKGKVENFRLDWLEKQVEQIKVEQTEIEQIKELAELDSYWKRHYATVHTALKELAIAMRYAYKLVIDREGEEKELILAEIFTKYAAALCQFELALWVWGDWARFLEQKAGYSARNEQEAGYFALNEQKAAYSARRRSAIIPISLRNNRDYIQALENYLGGPAPRAYKEKSCWRQVKLSCIAPEEALLVYGKLLQASDSREKARIYLNMAQTELWLAKSRADRRHVEAALKLLSEVTANPLYRAEAQILITHIYLEKKDYRRALQEIRSLARLPLRGDINEKEIRPLISRALRGLGQFKAADCFAPLQQLPYGRDSYCRQLKL